MTETTTAAVTLCVCPGKRQQDRSFVCIAVGPHSSLNSRKITGGRLTKSSFS